MDEKIHLVLLVISLSLLHHEVKTQKANFCNITETYFVEVTRTETILGFKKPTGILGMISGSKYENITRNVIGVEKKERVVEDCCKGYKKKDNQCVPIDNTKPPKESSSTTPTISAPSSSTTTASSESPPPLPSPEPVVTQASTSESIPSAEPSTTQSVLIVEPSSVFETAPLASSELPVIIAPEPVPSAEPTSSLITEPSAEPSTTQPSPAVEPSAAPEASPIASSEPPVTTMPEPAPPVEPSSSSTTLGESPSSSMEPITQANIPEPVPSVDSYAVPPPATQPSLVMDSASASGTPPAEPMPSIAEMPAQQEQFSETLAPSHIDTVVSENAPQDGAMLSPLMSTMNVTSPEVNSYFSSESSTSTETPQLNQSTSLEQSKKLINNDTTSSIIDSTTTVNSRRRRSLNDLADSVDSVEILDEELESNSSWLMEDDQSRSHEEDDFKLNEKLISVQKKHHHKSDVDLENIVVSDLSADIEDQGYRWVEVLEVLSFGAVVVLLVITVQASFNPDTLSFWKSNRKIPQEIDSYGEFWIYDSRGNLEEV